MKRRRSGTGGFGAPAAGAVGETAVADIGDKADAAGTDAVSVAAGSGSRPAADTRENLASK